jgi:hypothetical protein
MTKILLIPLVTLLFIALFLLFILFFKWLWNMTMPQVFGLKDINFWQAFRLLLIASFLFGRGSYSSESGINQKLAQMGSSLDKMSHKLDYMNEQMNSRHF